MKILFKLRSEKFGGEKMENEMELKKIDIMSTGKFFAMLYAIIGFFAGIFMAFGSGVMSSMIPGLSMMNGMMHGFAAIIVAPILYAILGFVYGVIIAFLYNIVANWVGGIKFVLR